MAGDARVLRVAEELASGTVTCAAVSDELARMTQVSPKCVRLVHFLHHYVADEDIRARDAEYAQWQLAQLRQLIAEAA
jgi:hypothetical protein